MCGVVGVVSDLDADLAAVGAMTEMLTHRGPDGSGIWKGGGVALGHTRLAIIDRGSRSSQPMHFLDRYVISFNGEIYNYRELRSELASQGYVFGTESDTEVIMAAYDCWGSSCLHRFNGMWAFALVDRASRKLFIARDRFGVKPMFFSRRGSALVFGSESKALLRHPKVRRDPNLDYCRGYLLLGPAEYAGPTPWEGVERLEAAHFIECDLDRAARGDFVPMRYWRLEPDDTPHAFREDEAEDYARRYRELLSSAVKLRLRSDVKVGSALSGGLDSSSIVLLVNEELKALGASDKQETFSCVYRTSGAQHCDESAFIDLLADRLSVNSNQVEPNPEDVPEFHRQMIYYLDHPPESTLMSSWHTFRRVAQSDVIVTLDGQGADEQIAGYPRYLIPHLAYSVEPFREAKMLSSMPGTGAFVRVGAIAALARRLGFPKLLPRLLEQAGKRVFDGSPLNSSLAFDCANGLQNLIHYADRTSMAFSVESRMPFLDFRVAEFLAKTPAVYKIRDGWTKYLARRAFAGSLPDEIVWRRDKMGWPIPEAYWLSGSLRSWFTQTIESSSFLRELGVSADAGSGLEKGVPLNRLTRLLNLAVWHDVHVDQRWRPSKTLRSPD
jgi:asparagine synthase (glutamine-hydrolysing)